jgi:hypothetical protein
MCEDDFMAFSIVHRLLVNAPRLSEDSLHLESAQSARAGRDRKPNEAKWSRNIPRITAE